MPSAQICFLPLAYAFFFKTALAAPVETTSWTSGPNGRGSFQLITSCVLTLTICVWSALHLNVPTQNSTLPQRNIRRTKWIILGIFAPELVVSTAFAQYLTARWLHREIQKDIKYRKSGFATAGAATEVPSEGWSITQCFFAVMGGIVVQTGPTFEGRPRLTLTAEGIRLLSFLGHLPSVPEGQIRDKSKADGLAKSIVCIQAGWMVLQILGRLIERLPVTLLEINTTGHVLCALILYLLWWSKPLEVKDPTLLPYEDWMQPFLSIMWMCSPISGSDGITEMRCMTYVSPQERRNFPAAEDSKEDTSHPARPHHTHFSIGSLAIRDPTRFLGPVGDIRHGALDPSQSQLDHHVSYMIEENNLQTAPEHVCFFNLQDSNTPLRHSLKYCRRSYYDCTSHDPLTECAIERWRQACTLIDDLWEQCQERPSYEAFYFTTSSLGIFVGETYYIDWHIPNFLGLSYLGHVNIHRDRLKSILAFAAAAYGGLHIAAWNEYFPSPYERTLWIVSATIIGSSGVILWLYFLARQMIQAFDSWLISIKASRYLSFAGRAVLVLFVLARVYLVVEAFVSLREVPTSVYATPSWTDLLPHL